LAGLQAPVPPLDGADSATGQPRRRLPCARLVAMDHRDHVRLIREGVLGAGKIWADLGSGQGAFTLALADLLGPSGSIHTVDRDNRALEVQVRALRNQFPGVSVTPLVADFTMPLELPQCDGIVMANSLHFERDKLAVLGLILGYLRPAGRLVLVEYDTDEATRGSPSRSRFAPGPRWQRRPASATRGGSRGSRAGSSGRSTRPLASAERINRPGVPNACSDRVPKA
jgi:SAM-dependent methyltransferase